MTHVALLSLLPGEAPFPDPFSAPLRPPPPVRDVPQAPGLRCPLPAVPASAAAATPHLRRSRSRTPADRKAAAMFAPTESPARDRGSSGGSTTKNPPRQPPSRGAQHQPATQPHRCGNARLPAGRPLIGCRVGRGAGSGGDTPLCPAVPKAKATAC